MRTKPSYPDQNPCSGCWGQATRAREAEQREAAALASIEEGEYVPSGGTAFVPGGTGLSFANSGFTSVQDSRGQGPPSSNTTPNTTPQGPSLLGISSTPPAPLASRQLPGAPAGPYASGQSGRAGGPSVPGHTPPGIPAQGPLGTLRAGNLPTGRLPPAYSAPITHAGDRSNLGAAHVTLPPPPPLPRTSGFADFLGVATPLCQPPVLPLSWQYCPCTAPVRPLSWRAKCLTLVLVFLRLLCLGLLTCSPVCLGLPTSSLLPQMQ